MAVEFFDIGSIAEEEIVQAVEILDKVTALVNENINIAVVYKGRILPKFPLLLDTINTLGREFRLFGGASFRSVLYYSGVPNTLIDLFRNSKQIVEAPHTTDFTKGLNTLQGYTVDGTDGTALEQTLYLEPNKVVKAEEVKFCIQTMDQLNWLVRHLRLELLARRRK